MDGERPAMRSDAFRAAAESKGRLWVRLDLLDH